MKKKRVTKAKAKAKSTNEILVERGSRYGAFEDHARITQGIKDVMKADTNWDTLEPHHKEALEMIAHKIGRILNGDPNYDDSWADIAGYSELVVKIIHKEGI